MSHRPVIIAALILMASASFGNSQERDTLTLAEILERVNERYAGEVIDAEVKSRKPRKSGQLRYEVRLLTPKGNILRISLDAVTGEFLEVDGHGFLDAIKSSGVQK